MKLAILIATVIDRRHLFDLLKSELERQIKENNLSEEVKIFFREDNKEMSIGAKRNLLLDDSEGAEYIAFMDSDDYPFNYYVREIYDALNRFIDKNFKPDCIGMLIHMTTNNRNPQTCCHSLEYKEWKDNVNGYDFVRNVTHFNPVKRELAMKVRFPDLRYGEDKPYSDALTKLCKTEVFINRHLFHYRYSNSQTHNEKYGFK